MAEDRGTRLIVSCWSLVAASGFLLFLRIYCKLWRGRGLWWDDHLLNFSWLSLVISTSINTYIVSLGFGQHLATISDENVKTISLNTILVATFGILATTLSKSSFAVTLYRLTTDWWMRWFLIFVIITVNVSMNLVWIFGFAKCTPRQRVWDKSVPGTCWDKNALTHYQLFAAYYSAVLDFVLAFLPWKILMGMTMLRRERLGVAIAMSLGTIAGATAIVKSVLVVHMTSSDFTFDRVDLTIWTLVEPAASIMAASVPVLRMLFHELKSNSGSYFRSKSQSNAQNTGRRNTEPSVDIRKSSRGVHNLKYGRNSVVILSTSGWQESQEALQDPFPSRPKQSLGYDGVMKTEEVRVHRERISNTSDENSIELGPLETTHKGVDGRGSNKGPPSY